MVTSLMMLFFIALSVGNISGQGGVGKPGVTDACLRCICQAVSGCVLKPCEGDNCGLFHITWGYWIDGGRPTIGGQDPESMESYRNCVVDPFCAARAVQGYMAKYGKDCNGDGEINCYDHMAIHKLGGFGCGGELPFKYVNTFNQCIQQASQG